MAADPLPADAPEVVDLERVSAGESSRRVVGAALRNLRNTCFLNAVLQCLTHTVPFVQEIRKADHSCSSSGENGDFCSFCALKEHINRCLFLSGYVIEPTVIAENLSKISPNFKLGRQEDAHEFLQYLLNNIHTCCLGSSAKNWSSSREAYSPVKQVFGGHLRSQLHCCDCGYHSNTCEPLLDLSLEINDVGNLLDALASFTKLEKMETKFTCQGCNSGVATEKQLKLEQAPVVLVLHLKRFKSDGISSYKNCNQVEYPLEVDLNPYLRYPLDEVQSKYDLYAVLVHRGSIYYGHYFCFIRSSSNTWHRFNDSMIDRVPESYVLEQQAYVLFYVKQGSSCWFSQVMEGEKTLDLSVTSPTSVLEPAEIIYGSSSSSEDYSSYLWRTPERHDTAVLCNVDSPTSDAYLIAMGEGEGVETPSGTDTSPPDLPAVRQRAFESNEQAVLDRVTSQQQGASQCMPIQIVDSDDEPLEDNDDDENLLLREVQVKHNGVGREASKSVAAELVKDAARMKDQFNKLVTNTPGSWGDDMLASIGARFKSSAKRSLDSSQTNSRKKNKAGSASRSIKKSWKSYL